MIGFTQAEYNIVEDDSEGSEGSTLNVCVTMMSIIQIERDFIFHVSFLDSLATGKDTRG